MQSIQAMVSIDEYRASLKTAYSVVKKYASALFREVKPFLVFISAAALVTFGVAAVYWAFKKPVYTASLQVLIEPRAESTGIRERSEGLPLDTPMIDTQVAVIKSKTVALAVINQLGLLNDPSGTASRGGEGPAGSESVGMMRALAAFDRALDVRRVGFSYVIEISYSANDPALAARVANAVADAYIADLLTSRADAAKKGSEWLEQRLGDLRKQMLLSGLKLQEFRSRRDYRLPPSKGEAGAADSESQPAETEKSPTAEPERLSLDDLEATAQTSRKIYEAYFQSYLEAVQRQSFPLANARVVSRAFPPLFGSPRALHVFGLALFAAILFGVTARLIVQWLDRFAKRSEPAT